MKDTLGLFIMIKLFLLWIKSVWVGYVRRIYLPLFFGNPLQVT